MTHPISEFSEEPVVIDGVRIPRHPGEVHPHWQLAARSRGATIVARVVDRLHVALRCDTCGGIWVSRVSVVLGYQPLCPHCLTRGREGNAEQAELTWLRRDPADRHYAYYLASCGHEVRRQIHRVAKVASGPQSLRCETCLMQHDAQTAIKRGWELIGPDPHGNTNYRIYRHVGCGHEQQIARINMVTGRVTCHGCGVSWLKAPNAVYLMGITLPGGTDVIKLGHSRDPASRLDHQLLAAPDVQGIVRRVVPMPSGLDAQRAERRLHAIVRHTLPIAVVPRDLYEGYLRVKSEIYYPAASGLIHDLLDATARRYAA
ncbi:GIY-YIG nuclease family protein [Rhodobacter capsulatus]|uniref:GIY-YIG nuclease family protein n=1 Tax=Rhodobacter capsulatus TaxID=1061 RepID=UPI004025B363